jgi:hypothetical protein
MKNHEFWGLGVEKPMFQHYLYEKPFVLGRRGMIEIFS